MQDRPGRSRHQSQNSIFSSSSLSTVSPFAHLPNSLDPFNILLNRLKIIFDDAEISADGIKLEVVWLLIYLPTIFSLSAGNCLWRRKPESACSERRSAWFPNLTHFQPLAQSIARVPKS